MAADTRPIWRTHWDINIFREKMGYPRLSNIDLNQIPDNITSTPIHVGMDFTTDHHGGVHPTVIFVDEVDRSTSVYDLGNLIHVEFPAPNIPYASHWQESEWSYRDQMGTAIDNLPSTYRARLEHGDAPHSIYEEDWRKRYLTPKPIQWDMMKILDHKCWKCQHWQENEGHNHSWYCLLQDLQQYDAWNNSNYFPQTAYFSRINKKLILEQEDYILCNNSIVNSKSQSFPIDDCPCFTESQEYHEWKEQNALIDKRIKMKTESIVL